MSSVDYFPCRNLLLDRVEKANELRVAMALHVAADDGAVEDIERSKQRCGAVTFVANNSNIGSQNRNDWILTAIS